MMHPPAEWSPLPKVATESNVVPVAKECFAAAASALRSMTDADLFDPWTFVASPHAARMPRIAAVRTHTLQHRVHHRAQLGVYLRLLGIPVPGLYGMPSAHEPWDA